MNASSTAPGGMARAIPDPCQPLLAHFAPHTACAGQRWIQQRRRRSDILATTRRLVARIDVDQVHLQDVAADSGISIQTIYNLVGNRAELMGASAGEWVAAIAAAARDDARQRNVSAAFNILAMFWSAALVHPGYVQSCVRSNASGSGPLRRWFHTAGVQAISAELRLLQQAGSARDTVDTGSLARQLTLLANTAICDWTTEQYDIADFRRDLANGPGLMLAGALRGPGLDALDRSLADWA